MLIRHPRQVAELVPELVRIAVLLVMEVNREHARFGEWYQLIRFAEPVMIFVDPEPQQQINGVARVIKLAVPIKQLAATEVTPPK